MSIRDSGHKMAWGAVGAVMVLAAAFALSAPQVVAQAADKTEGAPSSDQDARRYMGELNDTFRFILQNYVDKPEAKKLYEGAMKGMFESLGDPFSYFLDQSQLSDMTDITSGQFGGVGLYIEKQEKDSKKGDDHPLFIEVVSPIEDTPGAKYGLQAGDLITKIDSESTEDLSATQATQKIRGPAGTKVTLTIRRGEAEFDATLTRAMIDIPTVKYAIIPTPKGNIGYLRIIEFTAQTKQAFDEAVKGLDKAGYRALILDVRNDGGGLLDAVVRVADGLLDKGSLIVSTRGRDSLNEEVFRADSGGSVLKEKPIILLANKGSASASEILAGALKDNKRAYIVGENTYGKGSVQQIFPLDATGFRMTIARYYTPSDENIDKTGIPPDLEVKDPDLTDAETADLSKLIDSGKLEAFVKDKPNATVEERNAFASVLGKSYSLPDRVLRILVKNQLELKKAASVYDLEFDTALNAAIKLIDDPNYAKLLNDAKSVRELVEAKKAAAALKAPAGDAAKASGAAAQPVGSDPALPSPEPKN